MSEGDLVKVEKLSGEPGDSVVFDKVMVVASGDDVAVGAPYLDGRTVTGEVVAQGKDRKVRVLKFKRRKNYLRRAGHRQHYTSVKITGISS